MRTVRLSLLMLGTCSLVFIPPVRKALLHAEGVEGQSVLASARIHVPPRAGAVSFPRTSDHLNDLVARLQSADPGVKTAALEQQRSEAWQLLSFYGTMDGSVVDPTAEVSHGPLPQWETEGGWTGKCTLGLTPVCEQPLEVTRQNSSGGTNPRFSTVRYNRTAANWIHHHKFEEGKTLLGLLLSGQHDIDPLAPDAAVIVKGIWQSFNTDTDVAVPVYDPAKVPPVGGRLPDLTSWKNEMRIRKTKTQQIDWNAPCAAESYTGEQLQSVPIRCFVFRTAARDCKYLLPYEKVSGQTLGQAALPGRPCVAILVGVHIMTKELANWTWTTFWWSNVISSQGTGSGRPPTLPEGFRHMAMNTMLTATQPMPNGAVYSPYLEGHASTVRSCMGCHENAAYTPMYVPAKTERPLRDGIAHPERQTLTPPKLCTPSVSDPSAERCQLRTAFVWSLATNQDHCSNSPPFITAVARLGGGPGTSRTADTDASDCKDH